jgi:hypothetical protein
MNQKSVKERMKVVLLEVYICLIEYNSFNLKKFTTHLTNLLSKLENPDFSKESVFPTLIRNSMKTIFRCLKSYFAILFKFWLDP